MMILDGIDVSRLERVRRFTTPGGMKGAALGRQLRGGIRSLSLSLFLKHTISRIGCNQSRIGSSKWMWPPLGDFFYPCRKIPPP